MRVVGGIIHSLIEKRRWKDNSRGKKHSVAMDFIPYQSTPRSHHQVLVLVKYFQLQHPMHHSLLSTDSAPVAICSIEVDLPANGPHTVLPSCAKSTKVAIPVVAGVAADPSVEGAELFWRGMSMCLKYEALPKLASWSAMHMREKNISSSLFRYY